MRALGGLLVISANVERSRRVELQLLGRAGRQGDPGDTVRALAIDDPFLREFAQLDRGALAWFTGSDATGLVDPAVVEALNNTLAGFRETAGAMARQVRAKNLAEDAVLEVFRDKHYALAAALQGAAGNDGGPEQVRAYIHACIQVRRMHSTHIRSAGP